MQEDTKTTDTPITATDGDITQIFYPAHSPWQKAVGAAQKTPC
jgi:hypothetical protein